MVILLSCEFGLKVMIFLFESNATNKIESHNFFFFLRQEVGGGGKVEKSVYGLVQKKSTDRGSHKKNGSSA